MRPEEIPGEIMESRASTHIQPRHALWLTLGLMVGCSEQPAMPSTTPPTFAVAASAITVTDLGTLPGGTFSVAVAINDRGEVVGNGNGPGSFTHAILWRISGR